jgi:hypothetical protein
MNQQSQSTTVDSDDGKHRIEILQHTVKWSLRGHDAPTELDEASIEHITASIGADMREGEFLVPAADGESSFRGWWAIDWS